MTTSQVGPFGLQPMGTTQSDHARRGPSAVDEADRRTPRTVADLWSRFEELRIGSTSPVRTEVENCLDRLDLLLPLVLDSPDPRAGYLALRCLERRDRMVDALRDGSEV